ncbi:MAG: hypothetical protein R6U67_12585 [Sodalinema sp.]
MTDAATHPTDSSSYRFIVVPIHRRTDSPLYQFTVVPIHRRTDSPS